MATIVKPIEAKAVHQIQSGQVIVDLCSVVKELVENSLDAGADIVEVRFKNNGLDEIEVQDNGSGIAPVNYESVALKHYTSKLSTYDDLSSLNTFGFRGEALSSLCALSTFTITTAQADEAPKGHRLEFEVSGKLKSTTVVACQKGTIATVQRLFAKLPVRQKELSKNIKREYGKVLGLLHAYACVSVNVKFTVKNTMPKGKSLIIFATKSNHTTRENIANIYGARTISALVALDLDYDLPPASTQVSSEQSNLTKIAVRGHISKPVFGEGRQTPDRQMFFVNGRPCGLPQIAKAINEVYKSFNVSQSPFIFADFQMDTNAYDVNVSPDKRTILLHNATALVEGLKTSLTELFDQQDHTVPQSNVQGPRLPSSKTSSLQREPSIWSLTRSSSGASSTTDEISTETSTAICQDEVDYQSHTLREADMKKSLTLKEPREQLPFSTISKLATKTDVPRSSDGQPLAQGSPEAVRSDARSDTTSTYTDIHVRDFNARMTEESNRTHSREGAFTESASAAREVLPIPSTSQEDDGPGVVPNAFNRMRPKRLPPEIATITIGDRTVTRLIGSYSESSRKENASRHDSSEGKRPASMDETRFAQRLQRYSASGVELQDTVDLEGIDDGNEEEPSGSHGQRLSDQEPSNEDESSDDLSSGDEASVPSRRGRATPRPSDHTSNSNEEVDDKAAEEERVAKLIQRAEDAAQRHKSSERRLVQALRGRPSKDSVVSLTIEVDLDIAELENASANLQHTNATGRMPMDMTAFGDGPDQDSAEARLSLTVSKADFLNMNVVGQFNLGFILAVRNRHSDFTPERHRGRDELFIIDQHASDEKYNFEKLQAETTVGNQKMVRSVVLDLTAVEEEIVIDNTTALEKNGFVVEIDSSGEQEVGRRCRLVSLPLSKEVVFGTRDLDELIHLLAETPMLNDSSPVPRPSKVRKMFAMRACRSSIMIGKTLSRKQMSTVLQHMSSIDKPWNCPHGRPTMRHLATLDTFDGSAWLEGDGVFAEPEPPSPGSKSVSAAWNDYLK